jgi:microcystin-dependent protein
MSEPFIAEIKIFAGNFAPRGYAFCNGALLPISQNTALFSVIGTAYGGDGRTTTALPNLQGRTPMHKGQGPGLSSRRLGERSGFETATLSTTQMPAHNHPAQVTLSPGNEDDPSPNTYLAAGPTQATLIYGDNNATLNGTLVDSALPNAGGSQSHTNMQPYLTMNFIIALVGIYPSRG